MDTHIIYAYTHTHILHTNTHIHTETIAVFLLNFRGKTPLEDGDLLNFKCLQFNTRKGYPVAHSLERSWLNTHQPVGSKDRRFSRCSRDSWRLTILDAKTEVLITPLGSNSKVGTNSRFFSKTNFGIKLFSKRKPSRAITGSHDPMCGWYSPFSCS